MLLLYAFIDIICRPLVQACSLCLGIKIQRTAFNCRYANP